MRTLHILAVAALVSMSAACASQKAPAEAAVQALDAAVAAARPEIERFAPDRWPAVAEAVAGVQTKLAAADYAGVLADVQGAHARVDEATKAAAERKTALVQEWGAFAGIPAMVQRATQKIAEITASRRMPRGMDRASLEGA